MSPYIHDNVNVYYITAQLCIYIVSYPGSSLHGRSLGTRLHIHTMRFDGKSVTFTPFLTATVHTMYCDVVLIACLKVSQFILSDTGSGDVQKSPIWDLGSIGCNADEVKINPMIIPQCPVYSDIYSSTDISREVDTGQGWNRWKT